MPSVTRRSYRASPPLRNIGHRARRSRVTLVPQSKGGRLFSVVSVDSTHIRATFAQPVIVNPALTCAGVYEIVVPFGDREIEVLDVVPEGNPAASVLLTTTEHRQGDPYKLRVYFLEAA